MVNIIVELILLIREKKLKHNLVLLLNNKKNKYPKRKGWHHKSNIYICLHNLSKSHMTFDYDFDYFVEEFNNILTHEISHKLIRQEKIKYTIYEEVWLYKFIENLNDEEIVERIKTKLIYERQYF